MLQKVRKQAQKWFLMRNHPAIKVRKQDCIINYLLQMRPSNYTYCQKLGLKCAIF